MSSPQQQSNTTTTNANNDNNNRRMDEPFPLKLHRLLEDVENTPHAEILSWDPDGRSFTILQPKVFAESIMGQYFRQTKYKSFQRQMNLYGFTREVRGKIRGVYSHPRFIRHERDLCLSIKRSNKAPSSPKYYPASVPSLTKSGVASSNMTAASIDVSSPLFAPLSQMAPINLGLGSLASKNNHHHSLPAMKVLPSLPVNTTAFAPSFSFPVGGLASFTNSKQVSLDDEESMGTIDEMPPSMMMSSSSLSQSRMMFEDEQQPSQETNSEEFAVAAV